MWIEKRSERTQVVVLVAIVILGSCLGNLSQTALNAMFSGIAVDFKVSIGLGQWVTTLYMMVLGITVPVVTFLLRRFTCKQVVMAALVLLFLGALIDALAWSFPLLIVGRVLQAISTGITMPLMQSTIMTSFPPNRQATVMGLAGIALGFAPNIGPTIGGWMVGAAGWRSFFVVLTLCSAVLVVAALLLVVRGQKPHANAKLDVWSFCQSALGFGGLLLGCSNASSYGLENPLVWAPLVCGLVFMILFVRRQRRVDNPLISMSIFESHRYRVGFCGLCLLFSSFMGITLLVPLYIENLWGGTAFQAGIALLPGAITALIFNPLAGFLTDRIGVRPVVLTGATFMAVGACSMVFFDATTPFWVIVVCQSVRAVGVSTLISPLNSWGYSELSAANINDGSSFSTAARQAGASVGTALMVFAITAGPALGSAALGYEIAFAISAALALATLITALWKVR